MMTVSTGVGTACAAGGFSAMVSLIPMFPVQMGRNCS